MKAIIATLLLATSLTVEAQTMYTNMPMQQDVAVVVARQPRYVTSYQQVCSQVPVEQRNTGGAIVGGVIGAALGNQVGGGRGREIATAAGAVIGSQIGGQGDGGVEIQNRCSQQPVQVISGEVVTFEYKGRRFSHTFN
jgi:uncharacterized protein YcfJ